MKTIGELDLGFSDAENYKLRENKHFFNSIFLRTPELDRLCFENTSFLIGDKGTGKTAYSIYLSNNNYKDTLASTKFLRETEYKKFVTLKRAKQLDLSDFTNIWKVILLLLMSQQIREREPRNKLFDAFTSVMSQKRLYMFQTFCFLDRMPAPTPVIVTEDQRRQLSRISNAATSSQREAFRARIILGLVSGKSAQTVAQELNTSMPSVSKWRGRWSREGFAGLRDAAGRGRKASVSPKAVGKALTEAPTRAAHGGAWSVREMAAHTGLSKSTVQRLWAAHGIAPHRVRGFKLSNDLEFEQKYWDVVGLYLDPPQNAVVLCCDEKSQCQALERTQTGLPLGVGHIRTRTHDYYRHGTVTLFAALDYLSGKVLAHAAKRHRHNEWLAFLKKIEGSVAPDKEIHIICDNYATHKHPRVKAWLARKKRFHLHFTPTSASWLNLVERFFGEITRKVIRLGSFQSVPQLVADIFRFLEHHNLKPTRYQWTADPQAVLDKINRAWEALLEEMYNPISGTSH